MTTTAMAAPRKLPFWRTVGACYMTVGRNFGQLVRIGWLWLVIMLPAYAAVHWLVWPWTGEAVLKEGVAGLMIGLLPNVIEMPAFASIAVAWHRLVLRREDVRGPFYLRLDRVVWWYALAALGFYLLGVAPFVYGSSNAAALVEPPDSSSASWMPLLFVIGPMIAGAAIALVLMPRFSLVLPAIALGDRLSPAGSWRASRGNMWRLAWAGLLCTVPPILLVIPLTWYANDETRTSSVIVGTISSLTYALIVTIAVTLLSLAYRHFVEQREGGTGTT
jgi:hypothetical protein